MGAPASTDACWLAQKCTGWHRGVLAGTEGGQELVGRRQLAGLGGGGVSWQVPGETGRSRWGLSGSGRRNWELGAAKGLHGAHLLKAGGQHPSFSGAFGTSLESAGA